jgi:hypothetical protein
MISLTERIASTGLRQHMYASPAVVEEGCLGQQALCAWDSQCCPGLLCTWWACVPVG